MQTSIHIEDGYNYNKDKYKWRRFIFKDYVTFPEDTRGGDAECL
jgi:hypothetical protein